MAAKMVDAGQPAAMQRLPTFPKGRFTEVNLRLLDCRSRWPMTGRIGHPTPIPNEQSGPVHSDFACGSWPLSLMGFAGWLLNRQSALGVLRGIWALLITVLPVLPSLHLISPEAQLAHVMSQ